MRIIIDMQGAQAENRNRGIGRYTLSLVKAIVRQRASHEIVLALNGLFPETIAPLRAEFEGLVAQSSILVWFAPPSGGYLNEKTSSIRTSAELTYEAFLCAQNPDFIYLTSLFEGLGDNAITSVHRLQDKYPVAVTLFDLIPYIRQTPYLDSPIIKRWYLEKIEHLRRADLWLAISESARQEGIAHLGLEECRSINVSTDADDIFRNVTIPASREAELRKFYGLNRPFVMYTGGIDHRKNIEGLIRAYARLPADIRQRHQLAVICSVQPSSRDLLEKLAAEQGLDAEELVLTGYVPDDELVAFYNLCKLFIFPSFHEGFGLPALEAMRCGAPVVGANASSLPEVIGWKDALFDPSSIESITTAIHRGLADESYRSELIRHEREQAKRFSWDESARRALTAIEHYHRSKMGGECLPGDRHRRKRLAYVSPLPGARSGIADYSADLLPVLSEYYDIEIIVEQEEIVTDPWALANGPLRSAQWLMENACQFDRILYQFGNSHFHQHMYRLLDRLPGVVVLHDFFLSGDLAHKDIHGLSPHSWARALYISHGYRALLDRYTATDIAEVIMEYPANLPVLQSAIGIIVHSKYSEVLGKRWYGQTAGEDWNVIPLLRSPANSSSRESAKQALGLDVDDLLVCSFGFLAPTKLSHRLLAAWLDSPLATDPKAHLVFVGQNHGGDYGKSLIDIISSSGASERIQITGWADRDTFQRYLDAADIGVQLRTLSRGETSAAVLDCMNHGLATIVNANGSMADLDATSVWMLPDEFDDSDLREALTALWENPSKRRQFGTRASEVVRLHHKPDQCARRYYEAIESAYERNRYTLTDLISKTSRLKLSEDEIPVLASCFARNFPPRPRQPQWLVDVTGLVQSTLRPGISLGLQAFVNEWIKRPPLSFRVEPVYRPEQSPNYRYAHEFSCRLLQIPADWSQDEYVDFYPGDVLITLDNPEDVEASRNDYLKELRARGVLIWLVHTDTVPTVSSPGLALEFRRDTQASRALCNGDVDGVLCLSKAEATDLRASLTTKGGGTTTLSSG